MSEKLEEIKEEDEDHLEFSGKEENMGKDSKKEKELTPKEKQEKEQKDKVNKIIRMEYFLYIAKVFRVILFIGAILISLLTAFYKCNIWGGLILISVALFSFTEVKFKNVKWFTLIFCFIFVLQYSSALSNLNNTMSPSKFPVPFNNVTHDRPIPVPVYKQFGIPITNRTMTDESENTLILPTKWTFFLGFIISPARLNELWVDLIAIIAMNYFFIYFYSASYELDMNLNTREAVAQILNEDKNQDSESKIMHRSNREEMKRNNSMASNEILRKTKVSTYYDAQKYIDKIQSKMLIAKFYNSISTAICATSSIISLVCLLMIAFQIKGLINLIYIVFCLWYLSKAVNFVFQKNWTFPIYLGRILKVVVILELILQFGFQIPYSAIHKNENANGSKSWQKIIGLVNIWTLGDNKLPIYTDTSNLVLKCFMYAFILVQQNIFSSEEYEEFTMKTLANIRSFSDRKAESMAYIYNNQKLKVTIENQFEKDKMMKKLIMVNKQVKKWNATVLSKGSEKKKLEMEKEIKKSLPPADEIEREKIHEVEAHLEEEKQMDGKVERYRRDDTINQLQAEEQIKKAKERDKYMKIEKNREYLRKADLIHDLVNKELGIIWRIWIYLTRNFTNQILLVFSFERLNYIFESVKDGETKVYTDIEEKLYQDYQNDKKLKEERKLETVVDLKEDRSNLTAKATKGLKILIAFYSLLINVILSNSSFFCYLFMVICMIMNGSMLSLVYPISIFIYALLEEKRPGKFYWLLILNYTAVVLVLKFIFQTYPLSEYIAQNFVKESTDNEVIPPNINSINDYLRSFRVGLENVEDSGRNFMEYFLFEALILLSVTLHILILVFGGVWSQREVEAESIDQAATRISNMQKIQRLKDEGKLAKSDSVLTENFEIKVEDNGVYPEDYK